MAKTNVLSVAEFFLCRNRVVRPQPVVLSLGEELVGYRNSFAVEPIARRRIQAQELRVAIFNNFQNSRYYLWHQ